MATRHRPVDRGAQRGRQLIATMGRELRDAREGAGLSLSTVGGAAGMSASQVSRIERAFVLNVSVYDLARLGAIVGLDLTARFFAGGDALRDRGHIRLLARLKAELHPSLGWRTEVPLPNPGDQRAWDGLITGPSTTWRYGVEAETNPTDGQAVGRRVALKMRDGRVDGVILLVPDTRQSRIFRREVAPLLASDFPVAGPRALSLLRAGVDPGGNAIIVC